MASTTTKTYTVSTLTKYGFASNNVYINYSKNLKESDKMKIVPGLTFEAEVYTADSGKEYVNKILNVTAVQAYAVKPEPKKEVVKEPVKAKAEPAIASATMSKLEWQEKDTRISRQGIWQAAVHALAPVVSLEMLPAEAEKLANIGLEYVNRK